MKIAEIDQSLPIIIGNTLDLKEQMRAAVGERNVYNIFPSIPFAKLKRVRWGGGQVYLKLIPYNRGETPKKAVKRLLAENYLLGDLNALGQFMRQYPKEIKKYDAVFVLDKGSRWNDPANDKDRFWVPYASASGERRCLGRYRFDCPLDGKEAILVFQKTGNRIWHFLRNLFPKSGGTQ